MTERERRASRNVRHFNRVKSKMISNRKQKKKLTKRHTKPTHLGLTETQHYHLVAGFIRRISVLLDRNTIIPLEIIQICEHLSLFDLIISKNKTAILSSNKVHKFDRIIIDKGATLTTTAWNGEKGGKLLIKCNYIKIKHNGKIHVNGKGYRGGQYNGARGESYNGMGGRGLTPNKGGGGGGRCGSGGGYGTKGGAGSLCDGRGNIYGDVELNTMYLGSGGGGGFGSGIRCSGGAGGGILHIECERMVIKRNGCIQSNGEDGTGSTSWRKGSGGGGSGGSIYIQGKDIINDGNIFAKGGKGKSGGYGGDGGFGRIRIDSSNFENKGIVKPKARLGIFVRDILAQYPKLD